MNPYAEVQEADERVGLVTVTYNSSEVLPDFLESIKHLRETRFHLYVVDNASTDDSTQQVQLAVDRGLPITLIANETNVGVARGNNQGVEVALQEGSKWVLLLNNDTVFDPDLVRHLLRDAKAVGAKLISPTIEAQSPAGSVWFAGGRFSRLQALLTKHDNEGAPYARARNDIYRAEYAPTCALLIHRSVFKRVGLMDETFFVYFDDADFIWRANAAGFSVWVSGRTHLFHKASVLTGGSSSDFSIRYMSRNWVLMVRKHSHWLYRVYCFAFIGVWTVARRLLGLDTATQTRLRWKSYRDGFRLRISAQERTHLNGGGNAALTVLD